MRGLEQIVALIALAHWAQHSQLCGGAAHRKWCAHTRIALAQIRTVSVHTHTITRTHGYPTVERKGKCVHTATMAALRYGYSALLLRCCCGGPRRSAAHELRRLDDSWRRLRRRRTHRLARMISRAQNPICSHSAPLQERADKVQDTMDNMASARRAVG